MVRLCFWVSISFPRMVTRAIVAYGVDSGRRLFFGQGSDLEGDLYECAWYQSREDDAVEGVVEEGFEVSLFRTLCVYEYILFLFQWREIDKELYILPTPEAGLTLTSIAASSGISSRRCTSIGPFTAPMIE